MKVLLLFFVVCVLTVLAQRRPSKHDVDLEATSHKPISRSRGRTRFSLTPEFQQANEEFKSVQKTELSSRRKPENVRISDRKPSKNQDFNGNRRSYEVREVIDDIPRDIIPKLKKKPHVITETKFEATTAHTHDEIVPSPPSTNVSTTPSYSPEEMPPVESSSSEKPTEETLVQTSEVPKPSKEPEVKRKVPERQFLRTKSDTPHKVEQNTRTRTRGKLTRKDEQQSSTVPPNTPRVQTRVNRRRPEPTPEIRHNPLRTKGPSVFSAENSAELPSRSRPGRRVPINTNRAGEPLPEDSTPSNIISSRRRLVERRKSVVVTREHNAEQLKQESPTLVADIAKVSEESSTVSSLRRDISRLRQNVKATVEPTKNVASVPKRVYERRKIPSDPSSTTPLTRRSSTSRELPDSNTAQRARSRTVTKLSSENTDPVVTNPTRKIWTRRRLPSTSFDDIDAASTKQTEVRVKADSLRENQNVKVSLEKSFSEETKPGRIRKRPNHTTKKSNQIRESNSDVPDQPSKIPLLNLKNSQDDEGRGPQVGRTRNRTSHKKVKGDGLSNSQENIDESDNYPAAYKAAIKAKKSEVVLRSRTSDVNEASITKSTEATVTSSMTSTSLKTFPYVAADVPSTTDTIEEISTPKLNRYPRPRFSLTTTQSKSEDSEVKKYNPERTKTSQSTTHRTEKFHARYKSPRTQIENVSAPEKTSTKPRTYVPKPPKGIYSSRKLTRSSTGKPDIADEYASKFSIEQSSLSTKIPSVGLSSKNRFSARYRNEILPKSAGHRVSTTGPSYIPTVPTVTPSSKTGHIWQEEDMTEYYNWYSNRII